tara:strand:- start:12 stop:263 length:252 start_codon:yes stop_codon:yes gene_type:complete
VGNVISFLLSVKETAQYGISLKNKEKSHKTLHSQAYNATHYSSAFQKNVKSLFFFKKKFRIIAPIFVLVILGGYFAIKESYSP